MTNEHTDLPWSTDEHEHDTPYEEIEIRGADGRRICQIWMDDAPLPDYNREQRANARHIVHCVNNHELIKGKLKTLRDSISGDCYMGEEWELETIDAILGGMDEG